MTQPNWADSKHPVNSGKPHAGNPEPRQRNTREGAETRHGAPTHTCNTCRETKPTADFYVKDRNGRRDTTCKRCRINHDREKRLGVSPDDYLTLYKKQEGRCGVCRRRLYSSRYKAFAVDHNHTTGAIRGLLCHNCNRALGMLRDDPTIIRRAANWVEGIVQSSEQSEKGSSSR